MTAIASGRCSSAPAPRPSASGARPAIVASVVIRIGRTRIAPASSERVVAAARPRVQSDSACSSSRMPFFTTSPTSSTQPISDEALSGDAGRRAASAARRRRPAAPTPARPAPAARGGTAPAAPRAPPSSPNAEHAARARGTSPAGRGTGRRARARSPRAATSPRRRRWTSRATEPRSRSSWSAVTIDDGAQVLAQQRARRGDPLERRRRRRSTVDAARARERAAGARPALRSKRTASG